METTLENLQYPIGKFHAPASVDGPALKEAIRTIAAFPDKLSHAISGLSKEQLDTPYRPGGWTIRQVVHHCADSHLNALMRIKAALTEDNPIIKPYDQAQWAELPDSLLLPPEISIQLLRSVHTRWVMILDHLGEEDWQRTYVHPAHTEIQVLNKVTLMYAWHCEHHLAHITRLTGRMGWKENPVAAN